ncbi:MAG: hypothetical protein U0354_15615 [Candidatus Sericytochromatia bacterium]
MKLRNFKGRVLSAVVLVSAAACGTPNTDLGNNIPDNQTNEITEQSVVLTPATFTTLNANTITASNLVFPASGSGWTHSPGSSFHSSTGGYNRADDRYALDLNKNTPKKDSDYKMPVTPVYSGKVVTSYHEGGRSSGKLSFVLVQHDTPLKLDDGTILKTWFSGYMHMNAIIGNNANVGTSTTLGYISKQGANNNHLHFAVYSGTNTRGGLKSIDINTKLKAFRNKYKVV